MSVSVANEGPLESLHTRFRAMRERRYAKRQIKCLLNSYRKVNKGAVDLSGKPLYREVLLHARKADPERVDRILWQAESSVDDWTAPGREGLGFREVVHFLIHAQFKDNGRKGSIVSFGSMVNALVPGHL